MNPMSDTLRTRLDALVSQWRERATSYPSATDDRALGASIAVILCADELAAALAEAPTKSKPMHKPTCELLDYDRGSCNCGADAAPLASQEPETPPTHARSRSEYKRLTTMGANVLPPVEDVPFELCPKCGVVLPCFAHRDTTAQSLPAQWGQSSAADAKVERLNRAVSSSAAQPLAAPASDETD